MRWVTAASWRWPARLACASSTEKVEMRSGSARGRKTWSTCGAALGSGRSRSFIPRCGPRWRSSSTPVTRGIRSRRCGGHARARTCCLRRCLPNTASGSATRRWPSCFARMSTASRRRASRSRAHSTSDRTAQFEHINNTATDCVKRGVPTISVDTKKKELVGNFRARGPKMATPGPAGQGGCPRLPIRRLGQGDPLGVCTTSRPMTAT